MLLVHLLISREASCTMRSQTYHMSAVVKRNKIYISIFDWQGNVHYPNDKQDTVNLYTAVKIWDTLNLI